MSGNRATVPSFIVSCLPSESCAISPRRFVGRWRSLGRKLDLHHSSGHYREGLLYGRRRKECWVDVGIRRQVLFRRSAKGWAAYRKSGSIQRNSLLATPQATKGKSPRKSLTHPRMGKSGFQWRRKFSQPSYDD